MAARRIGGAAAARRGLSKICAVVNPSLNKHSKFKHSNGHNFPPEKPISPTVLTANLKEGGGEIQFCGQKIINLRQTGTLDGPICWKVRGCRSALTVHI